MKYFILLFIFVSNIFAKEVVVEHKSYDEALKSNNKIVFDMESTKAGIITTGFSGVVKSFKLNYDIEQDKIKNVKVHFFVANLDTDIDARNEKMLDLCLSANKFPVISVELGDLIIGQNSIESLIEVRGEKHPIKFEIDVERKKGFFKVKFKSQVSLKGLKIPDPSIFIASVRDLVEIFGELEVK